MAGSLWYVAGLFVGTRIGELAAIGNRGWEDSSDSATDVADMTAYTVRGNWKSPSGWQPFEKEIDAENEDVAEEYTYAEFGSKHGLKRPQVDIEEVDG